MAASMSRVVAGLSGLTVEFSTRPLATMERIGPYKIVAEIGRGGMGVVYRAIDSHIGRQVAVKVIRLNDLSDPEEQEQLRGRLFREARAAGILKHPGIVTIYYVGEEQGVAFIAMEYVSGPTLEKLLLADVPLSKERIRQILQEAAAALDYAHRKGIVHRDIKPANIMLEENETVKICDFGIAKGFTGLSSMTQAGMVIGTPHYMPPEQIQGSAVDARADQYSLAVIAFQALTGRRPFQADSVQTLFYRIMTEPPEVAYKLNPTLPPAVADVFEKALAKEPGKRYATCAEFVAELLKACDTRPNWSPAPHKGLAGSGSTPARSAQPAPPPASARARPAKAASAPPVRGLDQPGSRTPRFPPASAEPEPALAPKPLQDRCRNCGVAVEPGVEICQFCQLCASSAAAGAPSPTPGQGPDSLIPAFEERLRKAQVEKPPASAGPEPGVEAIDESFDAGLSAAAVGFTAAFADFAEAEPSPPVPVPAEPEKSKAPVAAQAEAAVATGHAPHAQTAGPPDIRPAVPTGGVPTEAPSPGGPRIPGAAAFYRWEVAGKPIRVLFSLDLMDRLEREVLERFKAVTKRGSEIGGVLGGRVLAGSQPTVIIEQFEVVECSYSRGPLYLLSDEDKVRLKQALGRIGNPAGGTSVAGFFRSNTRRELVLDEDDQALAKEFFSDPNQVFLLVRPFAMQPSAAGFFFWENGQLPEQSYLQFPFKRAELVKNFAQFIVAAPEAQAAGEPLLTPKREERPPAPPVTPRREEPAPQEPEERPAATKPAAPPKAQPVVAATTAERMPAAAAETSQPGLVSRLKWVIAALVLLLVAGGGYHFLVRPSGPAAGLGKAADTSMGLKVDTSAGQLLLSWNRALPLISTATRATLTIDDGGHKEDVDLDLATLRKGSIAYSAISNNVSFRLEVADQRTGKNQAESVSHLAGRSYPPVAATNVPQVQPQPVRPAPAAAEPKRATAPVQPAPTPPPLQPPAPQVAPTSVVTAQPARENSLAVRLHAAEPAEIPAAPALESQPNAIAGSAPSLPGATVAPPPPTPSARIGGQAQVARVIKQFPAVYPPAAKTWHISGVVRVIAVVGKDGRVKKATAISGPEVLRTSAVDSVMKWIYSPATVDGEPVEAQTQVDVSFHM